MRPTSNSPPGGGAVPGTAATVRPGTRIAGYLLDGEIGRGGMATVYRATDLRLRRQVALKVLAAGPQADSSFRQRFAAEARAAALVDDPHIVPVYEAGQAGGVLFIAMRLVNGPDVGTLVRQRGPLPPEQAMATVSPVAAALDAAHAAGLLHRDVKPANMLLETRPGRPDHVYLCDFGLSKSEVSPGLTAAGMLMGTADYIAPERAMLAAADGRADQYSLACAAFEMLTGAPPFDRPTPIAVIHAHAYEPPPLLREVAPALPEAAESVLARAMAKAPDGRFGTCREFAESLRAALGQPAYSREADLPAPDLPAPDLPAPALAGHDLAGPDLAGPGPGPGHGPAGQFPGEGAARAGVPGAAPARSHSRRRRGRRVLAVAAVAAGAAAIAAGITVPVLLTARHSAPAAATASRSLMPVTGSAVTGVAAAAPADAWAVGDGCTRACPGGAATGTALIEHFSGRSWAPVASPAPAAHLTAVAAGTAGTAWAAGYRCVSACGQPAEHDATLIYRWDGHALAQMPSPAPGLSARLSAVAAGRGGAVYAAGYDCTAACGTTHETDHMLLLTLRHGTWSAAAVHGVTPGPSGALSGTRLSGVSIGADGTAWAVGDSCNLGCAGLSPAETDHPLILRSGPQAWSRVPIPAAFQPGTLTAVTAGVPGQAWAVGGRNGRIQILHWASGSWYSVPLAQPFPYSGTLLGVSAGPHGKLWAVGTYCTGFGAACPDNRHGLVLSHDQHGWHVLTSPAVPRGQLSSVSAENGGTALAAGYSCRSGCGTSSERDQTLLLRLHGSTAAPG